jgi:hypothetical protein
MTVMVVTTAVMMLLYGLASWARGEGKILAETDAQKAVRIISQQLREARLVSIDSNGLGLRYYRPKFDANGNFITPAEDDGVVRRIELQGTTLKIITAGSPRTICTGIILTDPLSAGGTTAYKIFTTSNSTITRQVNVQIVTQRNNFKAEKQTSRARETIFLRNVSQLTK